MPNYQITVRGGPSDGRVFTMENVTRATASETIFENLNLRVQSAAGDSGFYERLEVVELPSKP